MEDNGASDAVLATLQITLAGLRSELEACQDQALELPRDKWMNAGSDISARNSLKSSLESFQAAEETIEEYIKAQEGRLNVKRDKRDTLNAIIGSLIIKRKSADIESTNPSTDSVAEYDCKSMNEQLYQVSKEFLNENFPTNKGLWSTFLKMPDSIDVKDPEICELLVKNHLCEEEKSTRIKQKRRRLTLIK